MAGMTRCARCAALGRADSTFADIVAEHDHLESSGTFERGLQYLEWLRENTEEIGPMMERYAEHAKRNPVCKFRHKQQPRRGS